MPSGNLFEFVKRSGNVRQPQFRHEDPALSGVCRVLIVSGCLPFVAVVQPTDLRRAHDWADFG